MKVMRWHPPGYGGERRGSERVRREGWKEQASQGANISGDFEPAAKSPDLLRQQWPLLADETSAVPSFWGSGEVYSSKGRNPERIMVQSFQTEQA